MLKLASQVRYTRIFTATGTWGSEYWWIRQATQTRVPMHCAATIIQNIFIQITSPIVINQIIFYPSMHPSQSHAASQHHYTHSQHVQALSGYVPGGQPPERKHILALLSSFTRQDAEVKAEQIEQLCCFDRMKKLIGSRSQVEQECKRDQINSIVIEQKITQMENKLTKQMALKAAPKLHQRTVSSSNFRTKSEAVEGLKKDCLHKFISHQVTKKQKDVEEARRLIDREVNGQVDQLIEDKGLQLCKAKEDNEQLQKRILELNLQIEGLKAREAQMKEYIEELEEVAKGKKESKKGTQQGASENFEEKFHLTFGECSIEDIKRQLEMAVDRCLSSFDKVENRNQMVLEENRRSFNLKEERLQKRIQQLENNENQLLSNLRTLKLNKQLSEVEAEELGRAKVDLGRLQKLILALYTQWHSERGESEKKVLRMVGCLDDNYSYEEMIKYVVEYNRKFSSDQKLNQFLFKVLRGIQKLRRIISPDQPIDKLDPLLTLDKIEKWIKLRVQDPALPKKTNNNKTDSYLLDN